MNKKREELTIKQRVKELFESGYRNVEQFEERLKDFASKKTIYKYLKECKDEEDKILNIKARISVAAEKALLAGLEAYEKNTADKDLQSLVSLLKQLLEKEKPSKELNEHIITFMDLVVLYFEVKGLDELRRMFQENIRDMSEFIRVRVVNS